jgi:hypothetical protein
LLKSTFSNIRALFYPLIVKTPNLQLAVSLRGLPPAY